MVTFKCCKVIINIITQCYRNTIEIGIESICNCFMLSNVDAIEFNGGTDLTMFFTKNAVDIRPYFLTVPNGTLAGYGNIARE